MKPKLKLGLAAALLCLILPLLSRLPRGMDWVAQYFPDKGHVLIGILFFGGCALVPAVVVLVAFLVSRGPRYWPGSLAAVAAWGLLVYFHHDNDLAADAQSALTLIFIPLYAAAIAAGAGALGVVVQALAKKRGAVSPLPDSETL
jgi:hypothetical protein